MVEELLIKNHVYRKAGTAVQARIDRLGIGDKMQDLPEELWHDSFKRYVNDPSRKGGPNLRIVRLDPHKPSLTVTGFVFNKFVHPYENRFITVREAARLQGFPDQMTFSGSLTSTQQQVGNAVPLDLGRAILESVVTALKKARTIETGSLKALSLFSGAGGFEWAARSVGNQGVSVHTQLCVDSWQDACQTLQVNFGHKLKVAQQDIARIVNPLEIYRSYLGQDASMPDLIYGGPPCQSFSQAGKQKGVFDLRGSLIYDFVRFVDALRPKAFVLENVSNLKAIANGDLLKELVKSFQDAGYNAEAKVLTAADYGTPQIRRRLFIIGIKKSIGKPVFPIPTHSPWPSLLEKPYTTVGDALAGLPLAC